MQNKNTKNKIMVPHPFGSGSVGHGVAYNKALSARGTAGSKALEYHQEVIEHTISKLSDGRKNPKYIKQNNSSCLKDVYRHQTLPQYP
jgi:hypothetical protein